MLSPSIAEVKQMEKNQKPLVSIVIPVYNGANYMREAIDSALTQSYDNTEVIVVNDGSRDSGATDAIARSYGEQIRYFTKENGGVSSALNTGIRNMRGEYFSWLSHDDLYLPDKIRSQVEVLSALGRDDVVAICAARTINSESKEISSVASGKAEWTKRAVGEVISWENALCDVIDNGSYNGCSLMIPRGAFAKAGEFDESLRYCQDLLMWMRIFLAGYGLVRTPGTHVCNRVHEKQLTQTGKVLFHADSEKMGAQIIPLLADKASREYNFLMSYARYNAKYDNPPVVDSILRAGAEKKLFTPAEIVSVRALSAYGKVRPLVRKAYYRIFRNMKTA